MLIQARICRRRRWLGRRSRRTLHLFPGSLRSSDGGEPSMCPAEPTRDGKLLPRRIFVGRNRSRTDGRARLCMRHRRRRRGWCHLVLLLGRLLPAMVLNPTSPRPRPTPAPRPFPMALTRCLSRSSSSRIPIPRLLHMVQQRRVRRTHRAVPSLKVVHLLPRQSASMPGDVKLPPSGIGNQPIKKAARLSLWWFRGRERTGRDLPMTEGVGEIQRETKDTSKKKNPQYSVPSHAPPPR
jgi:hypothetical protein